MNPEQRELVIQMINFCEENWIAFTERFEEATGEELDEVSTIDLRNAVEDME